MHHAPIPDAAPGIFFMFDAERCLRGWNRVCPETYSPAADGTARRHPLDMAPRPAMHTGTK